MKRIIKSVCVLLLFFAASQISAQSNSSDFSLSSSHATIEGESIAVDASIIKSGNSLTWNQTNDGFSNTTSFVINSSVENWDENTNQGSLTFNMTHENTPVDFILNGDASGITLLLVFKISAEEVDTYTLSVNNISYQ